MSDWFYSRESGCPDCGGMVKWSARRCGFCGSKLSLSHRFEQADDWARVLLYFASALFGAWIGYELYHMSKALLGSMIAVTIAFWYLYRKVTLKRRVETPSQ